MVTGIVIQINLECETITCSCNVPTLDRKCYVSFDVFVSRLVPISVIILIKLMARFRVKFED